MNTITKIEIGLLLIFAAVIIFLLVRTLAGPDCYGMQALVNAVECNPYFTGR